MAFDLTSMLMANPWAFDPSQQSNPYSNFNNAAFPYPNTYSGVPVNAATGQPIQSFLDWQKANPGGLTLASTPAAPQPAPAPQQGAFYATPSQAPGGDPITQYHNFATQPAMQFSNFMASLQPPPGGTGRGGMDTARGPGPASTDNPMAALAYQNYLNAMRGPGPTATPAATPQGPPNNWQAALNALANPGNPVTRGATVPLSQNYQPAGGVNQAFLQQAAGRGMNPNFISALQAIQGRPNVQGF